MEMSETGASRVRELQDQYSTTATALGKKISRLGATRGDEKKDLASQAQKQLDQLEILVRQMENELNRDSSLKARYGNVYSRMKAGYEGQREDVERAVLDLGTGRKGSGTTTDGKRDKLLELHEHHVQIDETTSKTKQVLAETEDIGMNVGTRLKQQREQLINTREKLDESEETLSRTRRLLNLMGRRVITDKLTQGLIILIELAIIAIIVWVKYFRK